MIMESISDTIRDILEEGAYILEGDPFDPNITFQELNMDSLDITRFVVDVERRIGIDIDISGTWPTTVAGLITMIEKQQP